MDCFKPYKAHDVFNWMRWIRQALPLIVSYLVLRVDAHIYTDTKVSIRFT
jgi:hypothetical protein